MIKFIQGIHPIVFLLIAATFEVSGHASMRTSIYHHTGLTRMGFMLIGTLLLLQIINFIAFPALKAN
ncbi:MAG TPA: hypothetical protein VGI82_00130 [Chitinophagaceae bacterium]